MQAQARVLVVTEFAFVLVEDADSASFEEGEITRKDTLVAKADDRILRQIHAMALTRMHATRFERGVWVRAFFRGQFHDGESPLVQSGRYFDRRVLSMDRRRNPFVLGLSRRAGQGISSVVLVRYRIATRAWGFLGDGEVRTGKTSTLRHTKA